MTETHAINTELYHRANRLFDNKRNSLPAERIERLATEVIQRLVKLGPPVLRVDVNTIAPETVSEFCDLLLQPDSAAPLSFILDLQRSGVSQQNLRYGLIAEAARSLGERWDRNEIPFIEVTGATGQLYALIRALKTDHEEAGWARRTRPDALFAPVPGETHTLGITIATETFRDAGWDIDLRISEHHDDLIAHVTASQPTVVGVSLSTKERLPDLIRLVLALRIAVPLATIGVAPALDMDDAEIHDLVDVDLIFRDARLALNALERLLLLRQ
ncbi:hypothetical protein CCR83_08610 [Rhodobacter veldkampii DSM 11550]|uniref:B12-binding domain-containing protein n=1 Tax=Phaeovulum veldkampii DSM 11550 TaxID=1185920 RepID=A0A2T4JFR6_9RHOB|nr:cobalamin B12-binding domain-containing protein [Phaeovulum veldkampii]MBK5946490.1 hypothetical protein [Phaeovulum veldkampii DSM 11550]PTE16736.1 hypothetical protein C5F46_12755 [Phaeovulum veldkampii DSM 11550]TDQ54607.1 methanogenic corrinoid protein MtbC1 [Phaeovulum veldkampii DSM 11550]